MPPSTVHILDRDADSAAAARAVLESVDLSVEVWSDGSEFLESGDLERPCCVLTEVRLPGSGGLELVAKLTAREFPVPVVFETSVLDAEVAVRAMKAGAFDYLLKPVSPQHRIEVIQRALRAERSLDATRRGSEEARAVLAELSERERQVLDLVVQGLSSKQIALALNLSKRTVDYHRSNLQRRLGVGSTAELVALAVRSGLFSAG